MVYGRNKIPKVDQHRNSNWLICGWQFNPLTVSQHLILLFNDTNREKEVQICVKSSTDKLPSRLRLSIFHLRPLRCRNFFNEGVSGQKTLTLHINQHTPMFLNQRCEVLVKGDLSRKNLVVKSRNMCGLRPLDPLCTNPVVFLLSQKCSHRLTDR